MSVVATSNSRMVPRVPQRAVDRWCDDFRGQCLPCTSCIELWQTRNYIKHNLCSDIDATTEIQWAS